LRLASGERIGVYEITAAIGEGGMGQVYRATDTTLGRHVAIKVLPDAFAEDGERVARFEREAKTLAALNHPHIAAIYGFEKTSGAHALVMELVEGEDLSARISRGAIPLDEALPIAQQIAEALQAAHEQGIVHRDLKPANIKLRSDGTVKVLDFGLAKAFEGESAVTPHSFAPTITSPAATRTGTILGTAAYMSPEQARGRVVDRRTDVWSFGAVVYEMTTGKRAFHGEDVTETIAAVVKEQPDLKPVPPQLRRLIAACLEKDPRKRVQAIGDVWLLVEQNEQTAAVTNPRRQSWLPWTVAATAVLVAAFVSLMHFGEQPPAAESVRFRIVPPDGLSLVGGQAPTVSPDGRHVVFVGDGGDLRRNIWLHSLDSVESKIIAGTEGGVRPFWSADSRMIAFFVGGRLLKTAAAGGPVQTIATVGAGAGAGLAGAWNTDGVIVFAAADGLRRISADGGDSTALTTLDRSRGEFSHGAPAFLPDGKHFLYFRQSSPPDNNGVYVGSIDDVNASPRHIVAADGGAAYVPAPAGTAGHLVYVREQSLIAQPFDPGRRIVTGPAVPISEQSGDVGPAFFTASTNGVLAYRPNRATGDSALLWFSRSGALENTALKPGFVDVALSPDGMRAAGSSSDVSMRGVLTGGFIPGGLSRMPRAANLWIGDLDRGTRRRLTSSTALDGSPVWSPDGQRIVFASNRDGVASLYQIAPSGGSEHLLLESKANPMPTDWSKDGRFLLYSTFSEKSQEDIWVLPMAGDGSVAGKPFLYISSQFSEGEARFSPDGQWVAYRSNETGQSEVYVRSFPTPSVVVPVSTGGGTEPRWRRDGRELFYHGPRGRIMAVDVATAPVFKVTGEARRLFDAPFFGGPNRPNSFDVDANGSRFLVNASPDGKLDHGSITILLNWQAAAKR
jgi:Tol biopolymer transport system component/tRNA A-37 threonylcarbamoyl transferase component Bud32